MDESRQQLSGKQRQAWDDVTPPGWTYNPSAWKERRWLIALAVVGLAAAIYTALEQFGVVTLWDPFFGAQSSYLVTHSQISRILPFPDGPLGVVGYCADLVFGALGGQDRWRRAPWLPLIFGLTILGLGIVSLLLTITQGVLIIHWCTVCLVSATVSMLIFGLGIGEALASLQLLARVRLETHSFAVMWRTLWGLTPDQRALHKPTQPAPRQVGKTPMLRSAEI
ncbi:MAG: vitamin K epoxide reductase family protein [Ktedonobacterales bacterium]